MDAIHEPEFRPWIGETMSPTEFKQKWTDALKNEQHDSDQNVREAIMQLMNIPESVLKTLEADCSPSTLCCGEESIDIANLPKHDDLMTLRLQRQDLEKRKDDEAYRLKTYHYFRKVCFLSKVNIMKQKTQLKFPEEERVPSNEVVLIAQVFKPIKMPVGIKKVRMGAHCFSFKIQVELAMLSCQSLRSLREKITCISDAAVLGDFSEDPDRISDQRAVELYKSGFFYIGNTFYNDMSDPACRDYSEVILEWAKNPRREIGPFKTADMAKTKLADLELRLGYPYVYVHQGYCEHLVVFSDIRVLHPHDSQNMLDYPVALKTFPCGRRVFCMLCHQSTAKWVTYENERVSDDPYFFCDTCFRSYNYTPDNKKIGKFRASPYLDWNTVL
ncbi:snRNA-activating protein complex subunit 3 [Dermacentor andersoni]|uniref:snRNA-activating protein complex subunit 3 n=1 Tax=Dermacentor andersoni TaxID=34620 RepID=UPI0021555639|nr:snRNA-activating protein complex subunit 3-like [Dermacentor andersoni]